MERVLIVSGSADWNNNIKHLVQEAGCSSIITASSGTAARRIISSVGFGLIIIKTPLSDEFGHELAFSAADSTEAGVIIVCNKDIADCISGKAAESGVYVISGHADRNSLQQALKSIRATRPKLHGIHRENVSLLNRIEEMRLINRAKCTLMQYLKFTEPQAHKYIEKQAMNTRQTRREVAVKILALYKK